MISSGSWSGLRTTTRGVSGRGPAIPARSRTPPAAGWPTRREGGRRRSRRWGGRRRPAPRHGAGPAASAGLSWARPAGPGSSGPWRLISASRAKYGGYVPRLESRAATNASSSSRRISGLVALSRPMVEVRSAPGGAEQNEPAPWVGNTSVSSGSSAKRRSERNWARASASVRSAPTRSVRAAAPTISDPPVKTASGCVAVAAAGTTGARRCDPGSTSARSVSPPRSTSSPSTRPRWSKRRPPSSEADHAGTVATRQAGRAGQEVGVQVRLGGERDRQATRRGGGVEEPQVEGWGPAPAPARRPGRPGRPGCPGPHRAAAEPSRGSSTSSVTLTREVRYSMEMWISIVRLQIRKLTGE